MSTGSQASPALTRIRQDNAAPAGEAPAPAAVLDWNRALRVGLPIVVFAASIGWWEHYVTTRQVPAYVLPAPSVIWATLIKDWPILLGSLLVTLKTTFLGLLLAVFGGVTLAVMLSLSRIVEYSLYP